MARKRATGRTRRRRKRPWRRWGLLLLAVAVLAAAGHLAWLVYRVDAFLADRSLEPLRIYSDAFELRPGGRPEGSGLVSRLKRLGYVRRDGAVPAPGEFRLTGSGIDIGLRGFRDPSGTYPARTVRLELVGGTIDRIVRLDDGRPLPAAALEPELLGRYAGGVLGERRHVALRELPDAVVSSVLAVEDARFARHFGLDPFGIARALWANVRGGRIVQGGSTITQQLAKNLFLTPERGYVRKANEAVLAILLELRLSKEEILELYLNEVYLGRAGSIGIYGVSQGARAFFGKSVRDVSVAEAATMAGVIHSPNAYSPIRHPERATKRRDLVLGLMHENGWLDEKALAAARRESLRVRDDGAHQPLAAPFFVDEALRRVRRMGYDPETVRGLSVYTTVDLEAQRRAEEALSRRLAELERGHARLRRGDDRLEGAAVVVEAATGFVRAMAGGRDFGRSQFNRVTRSRRQPGSAFKPFVYLAALDDPHQRITPSTVIRDEPLTLRVGRKSWSPTNYDGKFLGEVTVRQALEGSRNVPTVALATRIGLGPIATLARLSGLRGEPVVPAMVLGAAEVSLLNLAAAYTVFPNLGEVVRPALIRGVVADDGRVLYRDELRRLRVATAPAAYVTSHLLEGVVDRGTGAAVRRLGLTGDLAGKTGTTNDEKDAWFVGYSPEWVAGVWVGFDDGTPIGLTGSAAALPVWVDLMREILDFTATRRFEIPPGVVFRDVERESGLLATWRCPDSVSEAFLAGTEPTATCDGLWGWGRAGAPADGRPPEARVPQGERERRPAPRRERVGDLVEDLLDRWLGGR